MLRATVLFFLIISGCQNLFAKSPRLFEADNALYQYTGGIDFTNAKKPRFWTAGVYIKAKFKGTSCELHINDEVLWGNSHNYLEIIIDDQKPFKLKLKEKIFHSYLG